MEKLEIIKEIRKIRAGNWTDKSADAIAAVLDEYIKTDIGLYNAGDFLYELGECDKDKKESRKVFIHTGQYNADGYGILLGFDSEDHLCKSTGYSNFQYGGEVRLATEEEIKAFIWEVFNYQNLIREYGRS